MQSLSASSPSAAYLEAREDVAGNTADAFFNLYAQQMTLANAEANVAVNDTLYTLNKGRFEVGKIGENDLLKSELALLRARAAVDDAQLWRAIAPRRRCVARSRYPEGQPLAIVTPDSIPIVDADPDVAVSEALKNSSTMEQNGARRRRRRRRGIVAGEVEQPLQRHDPGQRRLQPDGAGVRPGVSEPARQAVAARSA